MDNQNAEPRIPGEEINEQAVPTPETAVPAEEPAVEAALAADPEVATNAPEADIGPAEQDGEDAWLNSILGEQELPRELAADEEAVAEAGLVHPEDMELEQIIRQTKEDAAREDAEQAEALKNEATQLFTPVELPVEAEAPEEEDWEEEEEDGEEEQPLRKRRPRWKRGYGLFGIPHILATGVWLAIILAIGVYLGRIVWLCTEDVLALGKTPEKVTVTVEDTDDVAAVAQKLHEAGMIRYPKLFQSFAELTEKDKEIEPGTYTFNMKLGVDPEYKGIAYDYNALILAMQHYGGAQDSVEVLFPEGYNCAQIFALLEEKGVCTVEELEEYAANGELDDYWFLEDVERGNRYCLEGYLSADTYQFYIDDEPKRVLEKFLDEFEDRIDERLQQKFVEVNQMLANKMAANGYSQEVIDASQLSYHDIVVMASIIQKETASNVESFDFALVFYNRLANPDRYPYLQCKSTMTYAEEYYYKGALKTEADREACEFNTFTQPGLPEKPICNPSLNSLAAALNPTDGSEGNYFYFVYDPDAGSHRFAETESGYRAILEELGLNDG